MALVRGRVLIPSRSFVKETFGEPGWNRLVRELPPAHRRILDALIVPETWYDRGVQTTMLAAIVELWQAEMPDVGRRLGVRSARHQDLFYLRPLLEVGGPAMLIKRAAGIYRDLFQGGDLSVFEHRDDGGRLVLRDAEAAQAMCSQTMLGFIDELIRLCGREPTRVEQVVCRYQGAPHCEFEVGWR